MIIDLGMVATLIGAVVATYQLLQIRVGLGPLWQSDLGIIVLEHILLGAIWIGAVMAYFLLSQAGLLPDDVRGPIAAGLSLLITVIVWGFVLRTHIWYRELD